MLSIQQLRGRILCVAVQQTQWSLLVFNSAPRTSPDLFAVHGCWYPVADTFLEIVLSYWLEPHNEYCRRSSPLLESSA